MALLEARTLDEELSEVELVEVDLLVLDVEEQVLLLVEVVLSPPTMIDS